jgi:hypothetical protein
MCGAGVKVGVARPRIGGEWRAEEDVRVSPGSALRNVERGTVGECGHAGPMILAGQGNGANEQAGGVAFHEDTGEMPDGGNGMPANWDVRGAECGTAT